MRGSTEETPWWMNIFPTTLEFNEGEEEEEDDESEEDEESEEDDEEEDDPEDKGKKKPKPDDKDPDKLLKALREERKARRAESKELKKLRRQSQQQEEGEQNELKTTKAELETTRSINGKLSELLTKSVVDTAIIEAATKSKFRDVSDALSLVNRADIDFELDAEDEEVSLDFDKASVVAAVQKLAKDKPHLLIADGDEEPSGGPVGKKKKKKAEDVDEEALRDRYPALRG